MLIVAILELLLVHVPPLLGVTLAVDPTQPAVAPPKTGIVLTVTEPVVAEHPVALFVNVNVVLPVDTPVTKPEFVTVAIPVLLLTHVPPDEGERVVVEPTQTLLLPVMLTFGKALTEKLFEFEHPVKLLVKVSVTVPAAIPVTTPELSTDANDELLLDQVPPETGVTLVDAPTQTNVAPPRDGSAFTVTEPVVAEHPDILLEKVNVAVPIATPVTTPELVTVAILVLLLTHVPPVVGDRVVVAPAQIVFGPVKLTTGTAYTEKLIVLEQPVLLFV